MTAFNLPLGARTTFDVFAARATRLLKTIKELHGHRPRLIGSRDGPVIRQ